MISSLLLSLALLGQVAHQPVSQPIPQAVLVSQVEPDSPDSLFEIAAIELSTTPVERRAETRFLSFWPYSRERYDEVERAMLFWVASMNHRRQFVLPKRVPGLGWKVYLSDYGWSHQAWEKLVEPSPYWAVSVEDPHHTYEVRRGWLSPTIEYAVRAASTSTCCVERLDRFLAKTGTDIKFGGVYSYFLGLPDTEPQLLKQLGIDEQFLGQNYLIRGGAVLGGYSIVARNNRELQLLPSPFGADERFFWRSLDVADGHKRDASVIENFMGTIKFDGGEHIWTLRGGLHAYYIMNNKREQVADVPVQIAQDHDNPHDARVIVPYKCVSCHGPKGGIRHFDDVISRMAQNPNVGLAVVTKGKYHNNQLREALEDYYLSDLGNEIAKHQRSYNRIVQEISGQSAVTVTTKYVELVDEYFYARIGKLQAARELAIEPAQLDGYLKQTGDPNLLAILAGESIQRSEFERAFGVGMKARIYPWERSPQHVKKSPLERGHVDGDRNHAGH